MNNLELLEQEAFDLGLEVFDYNFIGRFKGMISGCSIGIKPGLTYKEKRCVLCEEIMHYKYNVGDIIDPKDVNARHQELRARRQAYKTLLPKNNIIRVLPDFDTVYGLAEHFDVSESFMREALAYYKILEE